MRTTEAGAADCLTRWAARGFTLIKPLVVIAIIVVLASRLLLALARAKARAQPTHCLKQPQATPTLLAPLRCG